MAKAYFTNADQYVRYDVDADQVDAGYPKILSDGWSGLTGTGFEQDIDAALDLGNGKLYMFKGDSYLRMDNEQNTVDGVPSPIADNWAGLAESGFANDLDAVVNWGTGYAYFFKGENYLRYDIAADSADGGALPIAGNWAGLAENGFGDAIDAAVNWGNGKAYFFKGENYIRYDVETDAVDGPVSPIAGNWAGLAESGFAGVDTAWVKVAAGATPGPVGTLEPGTHVWYYAGQTSTDQNIPRTAWFPGSTSETDFLGHGEEIFNFVFHSDGTILRGKPHMRNHAGSHAWLNHNPGNLTGKQGGPDYGQYPNKFNWHSFLIFPSDVGYDAIAKLLRGPGYRDLNITDAFRKYAPESDGNNPVQYAQDVAAAAGVPTTTLIRELDDAQMRLMQDKIESIEGTIPGDTLTADSPELPDALRALLA